MAKIKYSTFNFYIQLFLKIYNLYYYIIAPRWYLKYSPFQITFLFKVPSLKSHEIVGLGKCPITVTVVTLDHQDEK